MIFLLLCHISTCLWILIASIIGDNGDDAPKYAGTWVEAYHAQDRDDNSLYIISFYWTITTIATVGYGDINGTNDTERIFCSIMMVIGVCGFSFANGSLSSILQNYD
jgi:hypothetical protein